MQSWPIHYLMLPRLHPPSPSFAQLQWVHDYRQQSEYYIIVDVANTCVLRMAMQIDYPCLSSRKWNNDVARGVLANVRLLQVNCINVDWTGWCIWNEQVLRTVCTHFTWTVWTYLAALQKNTQTPVDPVRNHIIFQLDFYSMSQGLPWPTGYCVLGQCILLGNVNT